MSNLTMILLLPVLGAIINRLFGTRLGKKGSAALACAAIAGSFVYAVLAFFKSSNIGRGGESGRGGC